MSADAKQILVANGKGLSSKANRYGPNPMVKKPKNQVEYIGGLFPGASASSTRLSRVKCPP